VRGNLFEENETASFRSQRQFPKSGFGFFSPALTILSSVVKLRLNNLTLHPSPLPRWGRGRGEGEIRDIEKRITAFVLVGGWGFIITDGDGFEVLRA
jgi:hypothetical protein